MPRSIARLITFLFAVASLVAGVGLAAPGLAGATSASYPTPGTVVVAGHGTPDGIVLFTGGGRALYVLSFDTVGSSGPPPVAPASTCGSSNGCTAAWPPLLAPTATGPFLALGGVQSAQLSTLTRSDGTFQVTYFGHPLYAFVQDSAPLQTNGENVASFDGVWHLIGVGGQPDGGQATVSLELSANGPVLDAATAFSTTRSLYLLTTDPTNQSSCVSTCATFWPPLLTARRPKLGPGILAPAVGTIKRPDGSFQITYFGRPLYMFAFDLAAGAPSGLTNGEDNVDSFAFGVWYTVAPSGAADAGTASVTSESASSPLGTILAYASPNPKTPGPFTLYAFSADSATTSNCTGSCAIAWPPLLTTSPPSAASGSGVTQSNLGAIVRPDGTFQVTYYGHPLYLFSQGFTGTSGEGITAFGGTFQVVSLTGTPE